MGRRRPDTQRSSATEHNPAAKPRADRKADAILGADLHLWPRAPLCREQDEWLEAMGNKLDFIRDLQAQHDAPFLVAGDILEKAFMEKGDQWFFSWLIERIKNWIVIPGQHDLPNHRLEAYPQSNLAVLERAGCVNVLVPSVAEFPNPHWLDDYGTAAVFGFPWGVEPVRLEKPPKEDRPAIAMIHRMTYPAKPPYPGADVDGGTAKALMKKMKGFDLILSGDNHEQFQIGGTPNMMTEDDYFDEQMRGRSTHNNVPSEKDCRRLAKQAVEANKNTDTVLVNPGSMMRTSAKQINHEPAVFLWYADSNTVERVVLPHDKDAVSREHLDQAEVHDERIAAFVESVEGQVDMELTFEDNVRRRYREGEVAQPIVDIIEEAIG